MDEKKVEYVAVPTTELPPPPVQSGCSRCPNKDACRKKARRAVKFAIAAAVGCYAIVGLARHVSYNRNAAVLDESPFDIPHHPAQGIPHDVPGFEYVREAADFMGSVEAAFGRAHGHHPPHDLAAPAAPECCAQFNEAVNERKHHKHHRHHSKHKDVDATQAACPCVPLPHHKGHHKGSVDGKHLPPPPSPPKFCKPEYELQSTSTVFDFSPEQFKRASLFIGSGFPDSGKIFFSKSGDEGSNIKVNVTVLHGSEEALKATSISAFDHNGKYTVEMKRNLPHPPPHRGLPPPPPHDGQPPHDGEPPHGPPEDTLPLCAKYEIHVQFPSDLEEFEHVDIRGRDAQVESCPSLKLLKFDKVTAGIGRGYVNFASLYADEAILGVLAGHVRGEYAVTKTFHGMVRHGSTVVEVSAPGEKSDIFVNADRGFAFAKLPADSFEGDFVVRSGFRGSPLVEAPEPTDLHIEKYRPNHKSGYYKTKNTGHKVFVHTGFGGDAKLVFE
ncbi:hypothetical protein BJV82DRAFT_627554 [Fennellomyces sp. T-0311]|nr:hypothetical protein BJV82DRAFT_627554 [Fennellomyces sp. T-0311]